MAQDVSEIVAEDFNVVPDIEEITPNQLADGLIKRLDPVGSAQNVTDEPLSEALTDYDDKNNSLGLHRLLGDGRHGKSKLDENGKIRSPGYTPEDAYLGPKGHYYLGPGRRRIGAGFGPRRRRTPTKPVEDPNKGFFPPTPPPIDGDIDGDGDGDADGDNEADKGEHNIEHPAVNYLEDNECTDKLSTAEKEAGTVVSGTVVNVETKQHEPDVKVTWVSKEGKTKTAYTDETGHYTLTLPRCTRWTQFVEKKDFSKPTVQGRCTEPTLAKEGKMLMSHGISPILPEGQIRFMLNWQANDKYLLVHTVFCWALI